MKKTIAIILAILMAFTMVACSFGPDNGPSIPSDGRDRSRTFENFLNAVEARAWYANPNFNRMTDSELEDFINKSIESDWACIPLDGIVNKECFMATNKNNPEYTVFQRQDGTWYYQKEDFMAQKIVEKRELSVLYDPDLSKEQNMIRNIRYEEVEGGVMFIGFNGSYEQYPNFSIPSRLSDKPVVAISSYAFKDSLGLKSLEIPYSVMKIEGNPFDGSKDIENISVSGGNFSVDGNCLYDGTRLITIFGKPQKNAAGQYEYRIAEGTELLTINSLTNFPENEDCIVYIPASVKGRYGNLSYSIGMYGNENVEVVLPDGVKEIPESLFSLCKSMKKIQIPSSVETLAEISLFGSGLENITLTSNFKSIGRQALSYCDNLKTVVIEPGVGKMGERVFSHSHIDKLIIQEGVTTLGKNCFMNAVIGEVHIPSTLENSILDIFEDCNIDHFILSPENTQYKVIGESLVKGNTLVKGTSNTVIPEDGSITKIGYKSLLGCSGIKKLVIPDCIEDIEESAFWNWDNSQTISVNQNQYDKFFANASAIYANIEIR